MMRECVEEVYRVNTVADLRELFPLSYYDTVEEEADLIIAELAKMNVNVYVADPKYFPSGMAGVYYTVGNDVFLNGSWSDDGITMLRTLRHEGWHAAQDAMAGTIDNNNIAIIRSEEDVPQDYVLAAEIAYGNNPALPWEREAKWAGGTEGMTLEVLKIINETNGKPWTVIDPTPLTREWLVKYGYVK